MTRLRLPLLALLAVATPTAVRAECDANNGFRFDWNSRAAGSQVYGTTYNYQASAALPATQSFTVRATQNGLATTTVNGLVMPYVGANNEASTGTGQFTYSLGGRFAGRTPSLAGTTNLAAATITFPTPVRDLSFRIHDIDFSNNAYRDWVRVQGFNGATAHSPTFTRPTASTVRVGPSATAPALAAGELLGTSLSDTNQDVGTVVVTFAQPVTRVEVRYGNYPLQAGETTTGQQWISIADLAFCPMPKLDVVKSSAAWAPAGPDRFAIPGSDVVYTITVSNTGGSPVDLNGLTLTDPLPPQVTFFNGDFDGAGAGTAVFGFAPGASGVSIPAGALAFSSNGGSSYSYSPSAGYDPAVNAIRFSPTGSMAANSSFSVSFRTRIK